MTIMDTRIQAPVPVLLPADPMGCYAILQPFTGMWVTLISGDFVLDGRLVEVARPSVSADLPAPVVTLDTGRARVRGPVLPGDLLAA